MTALCELPKRWRRITPAAAEPIHRNEVKSQCGLTADVTEFDADFDRWLAAARDRFEQQAELALLTQTWELVLTEFPGHGEPIELFVPPVRSIQRIRWVDFAGATQTLDSDSYVADLESFPAVISPLWGLPWPIARPQPRSVEIQFVAGYAAPAIADATANTLTVRPNDFAAGDVVRVMQSGGTLPGGLAAHTDYYVVNPTSTTIQLSATLGGAAIDLTDAGTGQLLAGEVPDQALQAIRFLVGHFWRNREATTELSFIEAPLTWQDLVAGCKWR